MRQNKLISFSQTFLSMCRETSELMLGILKDCLRIIEQLIVSKLVSHLLAEYICSFQQSLYFFPFSPLPQHKSAKLLYSNYCRTCHSNKFPTFVYLQWKEAVSVILCNQKDNFLWKGTITLYCQCLSMPADYSSVYIFIMCLNQEGIQFIRKEFNLLQLRPPAIMTKF